VEPDVLVGGEKPGHFGADDFDDIAQHGDEDKATVECEYETGAARCPHRELEAVQGCKFGVDCL
jgi:hypothetical protein